MFFNNKKVMEMETLVSFNSIQGMFDQLFPPKKQSLSMLCEI